MIFIKSLWSRLILLGLLSLGSVLFPSLTGLGQMNQPLESQLAEIFDSSTSAEFWSSRGEDKPVYREVAVSRCRGINPSLTAIIPKGYTKTTQDYPTLFWYLPEIQQDAQTNAYRESWVEFTLYEGNSPDSLDTEISSIKYQLTHPSQNQIPSHGIMRLELSNMNLPNSLKPGKFYQWQIGLYIKSNHAQEDDDIYWISGFLERVEEDTELTRQIEQANAREQLLLYAQARLWHETLNTLYELRRSHPNDPELARAWEELIASGNFTASTEELLQSSMTKC